MTRDEIIDTTDCPKCGAQPNQPCREMDGSERALKKNHVERVYRAQDIAAGKPDRFTGKPNPDHAANRRCPICHKLLKSPQGANDHMIKAHGLTRDEAKAQRKGYAMEHGSKAHQMIHAPHHRPAHSDFNVIDGGDDLD